MWDNPESAQLWALAISPRLWERRPAHADFARIRIGTGSRRAALEFRPPQTKPVDDLEPLTAISLLRFKEHQTVPHLPIPVVLRRFTSVELAGEPAPALALLRALVGQLSVLHSPDKLRIALLGGTSAHADWDWLKWLPHNAHPTAEDAAGQVRLAAEDHDTLMELLGPDARDRPDHDPDASPSVAEPFLVLVAQGCRLPESSRLLHGGIRDVVLLDAMGTITGGTKVLRLMTRGTTVTFPSGDDTFSAEGDALSGEQADTLARVLAPMRTSGSVDLADRPLDSDFDLTACSAFATRAPST